MPFVNKTLWYQAKQTSIQQALFCPSMTFFKANPSNIDDNPSTTVHPAPTKRYNPVFAQPFSFLARKQPAAPRINAIKPAVIK
mmetsp:Transcript_18295/g.32789  ORF Transcript_18295/g.32789 Transcript_18295/m.32789 type:complete len:83 (+) Transcript_18295:286-534(+)